MSDKQPLIQPPPTYGAPPPAYPPSNAPPAYGGGYQPAPPMAPTTNNTVIVTQPAPVHTTYRTKSADHYLTLSIFLTVWCILCGTWCALICTIPAIVFAINARDADARGDHKAVARNRRIALFCNIGGIASCVITIVIVIIIAVSVSVTGGAISGHRRCYIRFVNGSIDTYCFYYEE